MEERMTFLTNTPTMVYRCDFTDFHVLFIPHAQHQIPTSALLVRIYDTHGHEIVDSIVRIHRGTYAVHITFIRTEWWYPDNPTLFTKQYLQSQSGTMVITGTPNQ